MLPRSPSRTALSAAVHRAAHQSAEGGRIFRDPLAVAILGAGVSLPGQAELDARRPMRLFIAIRTRFAEDHLADAVQRGVRQLVVLGAGLDTYAYRGAHAGRLIVFEVDHPATQAWKRERLDEAGIALPRNLRFAPVDFEAERLSDGLRAAGFDPSQPSFFTWLGVVPYLTADAVTGTLSFIGSLPGGAAVVFDYGSPTGALSAEARARHAALAARVAEAGEPFLSLFEPAELAGHLRAAGFTLVRDWGAAEISARYLSGRGGGHGGHLVRAETKARP